MKTISRIVLVLFCICGLWPANTLFAQSLERPVPIATPLPAYPPIARAKRIFGVVLIDVQVNAEGRVIEAVVLMGGEHIRDTARTSALQWRFKPMQSSSVANYSVRLTFIFHEYSYKPPTKQPDFTSPYQLEVLYPASIADCFAADCP